ncbi:hypothetical protein BD626DRAFT_60634 [Schizophyllum amplum]|uniref:Transmembrane protein n=1 Tax=Schizophyllum amplum TaxID=97359 RepID=A0A550CC57_9AGAR|nr:hypothetical protein BD626DRAFT_60634 [Auriculariopsis ampla]
MAAIHTIIIVALMVELFSYGIYTTIFLQHMAAVFRRNRKRSKHVGTSMYIAIAMYCIASLHASMSIYRAVYAFCVLEDAAEQVAFLTSLSHFHLKILFATEMLQVVIADLVLLNLIYVVWGNSWWSLAGPIVLFLIALVAGIIAVARLDDSETSSIYFLISLPASLAENLLITALLAWRLRQRHRCSVRAGLVPITDNSGDRQDGGAGLESAHSTLTTGIAVPSGLSAAGSGSTGHGNDDVRGNSFPGGNSSLRGLAAFRGTAARRSRLLRISRTIVKTSAIWHVLFAVFAALAVANSQARTIAQAALATTAGMVYSLLTLRLYRLLDSEGDHPASWQWQMPTIHIRAPDEQRRSLDERRSSVTPSPTESSYNIK